MLGRRHSFAALAAALGGAFALLGSGAPGVGAQAACAQSPVPPLPIPTVGPLDPSCGKLPDADNDGVLDHEDNCQGYYNPSQNDTDKDSGEPPYPLAVAQARDPSTGGDTCDTDDDADKRPDASDNCPKVVNPDQSDSDGDGIGDACDGDPAAAAPAAVSAAAKKAPRLTIVGLARTQRVAAIQAGVTVPVRCSSACVISGELRVDRKTAKKLRLARGPAVLGKGAAGLEQGGTTFVFVRFARGALKRVTRAKRASATLTLTVSDDVGHKALVTRRLLLKR